MKTRVRRLSAEILRLFLVMAAGMAVFLAAALLGLADNLRNYAVETNAALAKVATAGIEQFLQEPARNLGKVLEMLEDSTVLDPEREQEYLDRVLARYTYFRTIQILDPSGSIVHQAPFSQGMQGISLKGTSYFKKAQEGVGTIISETFVAPDTGLPAVAMVVKGPNGYAVGQLDLASLSDQFRYLDQQEHLVVFLDSTFTYILHPDPLHVMRRETDTLYWQEYRKQGKRDLSFISIENGVTYLAIATWIRDLDWTIVIRERAEHVFGPIASIAGLLLAASLATGLVTLVLSRRLAGRVTGVMDTFMSQASLIASGHYGEAIARGTYLEFNELASSFHRMRDAVRDRENRLSASELRYRLMFEDSSLGMFRMSMEGRLLHANLAFLDLTGHEDLSSALSDLHDAGSRLFRNPLVWSNLVNRLLISSSGRVIDELSIVRRDGGIADIRMHLRSTMDIETGERVIDGFAEDITARKEIDRQVRIINEQLEERVALRTRELEQAHRVLVASEKMATLGQLIAGIAHEINTPLGAIESSGVSLMKYLEEGPPELAEFHGNMTEGERNLLWHLISQTVSAVESTHIIDRSARKQLASLLEARGVADADGKADDLADMGISQLDKSLLDRDPETLSRFIKTAYDLAMARKAASIIKHASRKASKVILALRTYAHKGIANQDLVVDLEETAEMVLTLFQNQTKDRVEIHRAWEHGLKVRGDPDALSQVISNLLTNALQAMEYKGTIEIGSTMKGGMAECWVANSGPPVPEDIRDKLFDPFFTTKGRGEGSGLGLSICRQILDRHGGSIMLDMDSAITRFVIRLPLEDKA